MSEPSFVSVHLPRVVVWSTAVGLWLAVPSVAFFLGKQDAESQRMFNVLDTHLTSGPHDEANIQFAVFGITQNELRDDVDQLIIEQRLARESLNDIRVLIQQHSTDN